MINNLALLLKSKVALVALGALVIAAATGTAVLAANNRGNAAPLAVSTTPSPGAQCSSMDHGTGHTSSSQKDDRSEADDRNANQHDLNGTITSIDTSNSSFVVKQCDGTSRTVTVSSKTRLADGLRSFSDLKVGMSVVVEGNLQSNGTFTATSVHRMQSESNDDHDGSDGSSAGGDHHTGTPVAGTHD